EALPNDAKNPDIPAIAAAIYEDYTKRKQYMPGIGHRTHAEGDPRADTLFAIARETGVYGKYCDLLQALSKVATERRKRLIPVNVTGAIGAIAHIAEEIQNPMATQIDAAVKQALVYEPVRT